MAGAICVVAHVGVFRPVPISAGGGFTRTGICTLVDMNSLEIEVDVGESFPEAVQLRLDSTIAEQTLGWSPLVDIDTAVRWTAEWHRAAPDGSERRTTSIDQIRRYLEMLPK